MGKTVTQKQSNLMRLGLAAALAMVWMSSGSGALAETTGQGETLYGRHDAAYGSLGEDRRVTGERYAPTIWIDPDGCEHWVMDDGFEGYMDLRRDRNGRPICHKVNACGVVNSDQLFVTDSYQISAAGRARLEEFFRSANARAYTIIGHTDSRASDAYNMELSRNRAEAVASIARATGAQISDVRGYGERKPVASNGTSAGMAKNRRVEIICVK